MYDGGRLDCCCLRQWLWKVGYIYFVGGWIVYGANVIVDLFWWRSYCNELLAHRRPSSSSSRSFKVNLKDHVFPATIIVIKVSSWSYLFLFFSMCSLILLPAPSAAPRSHPHPPIRWYLRCVEWLFVILGRFTFIFCTFSWPKRMQCRCNRYGLCCRECCLQFEGKVVLDVNGLVTER